MLRLPVLWVISLLLLLSIATVGCGSGATPEPAPAEPAPTAVVSAEPAAQPGPTAPATQPAAAPVETEPAAPQTTAPMAATETAPEPTTASAPEPEPEPTATPELLPTVAPEPEPPAGAGYVIGEGSEATFTVNEKLAWLDLPNDAVMRTTGLTGNIYLDGQASVIDLDLHSMTSDSDRRDGYVQRRMFPDHRVATFTVADLGDLPDPLPEGEVISREVQGELSIRGVTKPIVFEIEARLDPGKLFVLGRTTFTWDELEIPPPNIPGRIQVKDEVRVEVLLSAVPVN